MHMYERVREKEEREREERRVHFLVNTAFSLLLSGPCVFRCSLVCVYPFVKKWGCTSRVPQTNKDSALPAKMSLYPCPSNVRTCKPAAYYAIHMPHPTHTCAFECISDSLLATNFSSHIIA